MFKCILCCLLPFFIFQDKKSFQRKRCAQDFDIEMLVCHDDRQVGSSQPKSNLTDEQIRAWMQQMPVIGFELLQKPDGPSDIWSDQDEQHPDPFYTPQR